MAQTAKEQEITHKEKDVQESTDKLVKFGGFDLLEGSIEGAQNLNPERKARKKIFLSEEDKDTERARTQKDTGNMG